jgi:hypothetical protein
MARRDSWDFCYSYYHRAREQIQPDFEAATMYLAAYLASFGMYQGSSHLLQRSTQFLHSTARAGFDSHIPDVPDYPTHAKHILEKKEELKELLETNSETLVTKVMMGMLGNVPAFDIHFKEFIGYSRLTEESLEAIYTHYQDLKDAYDKPTTTKGFEGANTNILVPIARKIDVYGFSRRMI